MAAPVPVLSRMSVLVCLPPNVIGRVSPAEVAISTKRMTGAVSASRNAVRIAIPAAPRRRIIARLRIVAEHSPAAHGHAPDPFATQGRACIPARCHSTDAFFPAAGRATREPLRPCRRPATPRELVPPPHRSDWREPAPARNRRDTPRSPVLTGPPSQNRRSPPLSRSFRNAGGQRGPTHLHPRGQFEAHLSELHRRD